MIVVGLMMRGNGNTMVGVMAMVRIDSWDTDDDDIKSDVSGGGSDSDHSGISGNNGSGDSECW